MGEEATIRNLGILIHIYSPFIQTKKVRPLYVFKYLSCICTISVIIVKKFKNMGAFGWLLGSRLMGYLRYI